MIILIHQMVGSDDTGKMINSGMNGNIKMVNEQMEYLKVGMIMDRRNLNGITRMGKKMD